VEAHTPLPFTRAIGYNSAVNEASAEARKAAGPDPVAARQAVTHQHHWYHTMEVAPGVETPGWFDLRPIVDRMPWPDVSGKRCLDVGPYDGFIAFELERRGADKVVAADVSSHGEWDWAVPLREKGPEALTVIAGADPGAGFKIARRLLASAVERVELSVYDLSPERLGTFDVVTCGSLLLHLKDPVRALEAIRSVCDGLFLSAEAIDLNLTAFSRRRPLAALRGGQHGQWWIPNPAGHRQMLESAGFLIEPQTRPYAIPLGPGHPERARAGGSLRRRLLARVVTGAAGVPHVAVVARPAG
jgi:tRNA (mo5U34)-methyltransferase